jgi:hypothetical protein
MLLFVVVCCCLLSFVEFDFLLLVNAQLPGGRSDAIDASGWKLVQPNGNYSATFHQQRAQATLIGLSDREFVALVCRFHSCSTLLVVILSFCAFR